MSRWHAVRIRADLYRALQAQAVAQSRSVAGQLDFVLTRALEQETGVSASSARVLEDDLASSPVRASDERADGETGAGTVSHRPSPSSTIPGQTTVDEMLASCPQCAGEFKLEENYDGDQWMQCSDCGFVREPEGT
jgi:hypothetical protein